MRNQTFLQLLSIVALILALLVCKPAVIMTTTTSPAVAYKYVLDFEEAFGDDPKFEAVQEAYQ